MCDIEFTIEQGRLFLLQTRVGKRTAMAALRMAVEMEGEGLIDKREAILRIQPAQLDQLLHPQFDPAAKYDVLATGLNASPGAAVGKVSFTADDAEASAASRGSRDPRAPRDLARGPARHDRRGGHPDVARRAREPRRGRGARDGQARLCAARRSICEIDVDGERVSTVGNRAITVREGDVISINGGTGEVVVGEVPVVTPEPTGPFGIVLGWADEVRTHEGAHQRGPARGRAGGARVRRRGHRSLPDRAHVPR